MQTPEVPGHVNPEVLGAGAVRVLLLKKVIYSVKAHLLLGIPDEYT